MAAAFSEHFSVKSMQKGGKTDAKMPVWMQDI